jgi:hypothetical protein
MRSPHGNAAQITPRVFARTPKVEREHSGARHRVESRRAAGASPVRGGRVSLVAGSGIPRVRNAALGPSGAARLPERCGDRGRPDGDRRHVAGPRPGRGGGRRAVPATSAGGHAHSTSTSSRWTSRSA